MSSLSNPRAAGARARPLAPPSDAVGGRRRRRAMYVTGSVTVASFVLLVDLLLVGHTSGEEIWGPLTAAFATGVGLVSLAFLAVRGTRRWIRFAIYALWLTVAFFGYGGYNDHRLAAPAGTVDPRPRPPLAPLVFTGLGIAGALSLRYGAKEE